MAKKHLWILRYKSEADPDKRITVEWEFDTPSWEQVAHYMKCKRKESNHYIKEFVLEKWKMLDSAPAFEQIERTKFIWQDTEWKDEKWVETERVVKTIGKDDG